MRVDHRGCIDTVSGDFDDQVRFNEHTDQRRMVLPAGAYRILEQPGLAWRLADLTCTGGERSRSLARAGASMASA